MVTYIMIRESQNSKAALAWAQRIDVLEPRPPCWKNALVAPGEPACRIEGLVHAIAWWEDRVAVVGSSEILVLQRAAIVPR